MIEIMLFGKPGNVSKKKEKFEKGREIFPEVRIGVNEITYALLFSSSQVTASRMPGKLRERVFYGKEGVMRLDKGRSISK